MNLRWALLACALALGALVACSKDDESRVGKSPKEVTVNQADPSEPSPAPGGPPPKKPSPPDSDTASDASDPGARIRGFELPRYPGSTILQDIIDDDIVRFIVRVIAPGDTVKAFYREKLNPIRSEVEIGDETILKGDYRGREITVRILSIGKLTRIAITAKVSTSQAKS